jgi:hypothetical protein
MKYKLPEDHCGSQILKPKVKKAGSLLTLPLSPMWLETVGERLQAEVPT